MLFWKTKHVCLFENQLFDYTLLMIGGFWHFTTLTLIAASLAQARVPSDPKSITTSMMEPFHRLHSHSLNSSSYPLWKTSWCFSIYAKKSSASGHARVSRWFWVNCFSGTRFRAPRRHQYHSSSPLYAYSPLPIMTQVEHLVYNIPRV